MYKKGDESLKVQRIKQRLLDLGHLETYEDAKFDSDMENAVKAFQKDKGLKADGIIGEKTFAALYPELQPEPSTISDILSPAGEKLIIEFEVGGGKNYYSKYLARPSYPGYQSGVTIGVGYDLGYYSTNAFYDDWAILDDDIKNRLAKCIGAKASSAKKLIPSVKDIVIPWDIAYNVFINVTVPKWYKTTLKTFPGLEKLPKDAQGALVSLVFNRGGLIDNSPRRREMKAIRGFVAQGNLKAIASEIRKMKRLWVGTEVEGLLRRRDEEAKLIENA